MQSSNDQTSKVESPATQVAVSNLASTATASGSAVEVFKFKISDLGTADGLATKVTQVKVKKSSGLADWTDHIAGASLWDGGTQITTGTVVITDADITFPITSGNLDVANNSSKEITMKIWLKTTNIVDNATMVFTVSQTSHGFTADATGSGFAADFGSAVTGNTMTIAVAATELRFTTAPSATACPNTNLATPPVVKATDSNGATDSDFTGQVTLTNSGSIGMSNYQMNAVSGVANYSNLQFTTTGNVTLSAESSGLTGAGPTSSIAIGVENASSTSATNGNAQSVLTWTNPSCLDEIMVVAKAGSAVTASPSGDGTSYSADLAFGSGTGFDGGYVVYKGGTSPQTVTGLTNGTTYHFSFFTRKGSIWSTGVTTTSTPGINTDFFRSKASGNWNVTGTWQNSSDGNTWGDATTTPDATNTVYIQSGHTVTLTGNAACNDLHIANSTTSNLGTRGIVAIETYTLEVNGKLRTYYAAVGTVPGTSSSNGFLSYPFTGSTGKISIVGNSRNLTNIGEWGATITTASTGFFPLEINLSAGQTVTLGTNLKCSALTVTTGTLEMSIFSLSADNGTTGQGDITIGSNAIVSSAVTGSPSFQRTGTTRAGTLTVNGLLVFTGLSPQIAMNTIAFNGTVEYGRSGSQTLAVLANSGTSPNIYNNLKISGTNTKTLGVGTTVNGTLEMAGSTAVLALGSYSLTFGSSSTLKYAASIAQTTSNAEFPASPTVGPKNLTISNSNGVTLNSDKVINGTVTVPPSGVFNANTYTISGTGDFDVQPGATFITAHANGINGSNATTGGISLFDEGASYTFNGSSAQVTGTMLPATVNNLTIDNASGVTLSNPAVTVSGTLAINSGKKFEIGPGKQVTAATIANSGGTAGLVIKSDVTGTGSLKNDTRDVPATVERYVAAADWGDAGSGWHMLSSPVETQEISGSWTPSGAGNDYDFYAWSESATSENWLNKKVAGNNITSFFPGKGYFVAYQSASTPPFQGDLNAEEASITGLTRTAGNAYAGFNLVGNPFPCAIDWAGVTKDNVSNFAQVWNSTAGSYTALNNSGAIPAMNGFFVYVLSGDGGSITIPTDAKLHSSTPWYKSSMPGQILLMARDLDHGTAQPSVICFHENGKTGFDPAEDCPFMAGFAPQLYTRGGNQWLAVNTLPNVTNETSIPLWFTKNSSTNFKISLEESVEAQVFLTDKKMNQTVNLSQNGEYQFTSQPGDDPQRFMLHFASVGVDENRVAPQISIFSRNNKVMIRTLDHRMLNGKVRVFNMLGQVVNENVINNLPDSELTVDAPSAYYIVSVVTQGEVVTRKIFIQSAGF